MMIKKLGKHVLTAALIVSVSAVGALGVATNVSAHDIPAYQKKNVYETTRVKTKAMPIQVSSSEEGLKDTISFEFYNTTRQEEEMTVETVDGVLPSVSLIKNHNYLIRCMSKDYQMDRLYVWVKSDGTMLNIKENASYPFAYPAVTSFTVKKASNDPEDNKRLFTNIAVKKGEGFRYNVKFKLVSDVETLEASSGNNGYLRVSLLEEVTYMVIVDSDEYGVDPFPIAAKDKSEYKNENAQEYGRFAYNHSNCKRVDTIQLIEKSEMHKSDTVLKSESGKTTVEGMDFQDFLLMDNVANTTVAALSGRDYEVVDFKVINPHRWEISKLAIGDFSVKKEVEGDKVVEKLYMLEKDGSITEIPFTQDGNTVAFSLTDLSLRPVVFDYGEQKTVAKGKVKSIKLTAKKSVKAGKKLKIKAKVATTGDGANTKLKWKSSKKKYATVSSKGVVKAKKAGKGKKVKITAYATDGSKVKKSITIKIK